MHTYIHSATNTHIYTYTHTYTHKYTHTYIHIIIILVYLIYMHTYIHAHIYTYICPHTCTYTQAKLLYQTKGKYSQLNENITSSKVGSFLPFLPGSPISPKTLHSTLCKSTSLLVERE